MNYLSLKKENTNQKVILEIVHETQKAYLVKDGNKNVWIAKSQLSNNMDDIRSTAFSSGEGTKRAIQKIAPFWLYNTLLSGKKRLIPMD